GLYRHAFLMADVEPSNSRTAAETILGRFLDTHALVGLRDVLERYPFERDWAERKLKAWAESGRFIAVRNPQAKDAVPQWSAPGNLEQVQRGTLALLRQEIVACPAAQFAEFVLRWQGVHPATCQKGADGIAAALSRLEGLPLPAELWEGTVLPTRVSNYQPRDLDGHLANGAWVWACQGSEDRAPSLLAFWQ